LHDYQRLPIFVSPIFHLSYILIHNNTYDVTSRRAQVTGFQAGGYTPQVPAQLMARIEILLDYIL